MNSQICTPTNTPFVLIIRDGWGENPNPNEDEFNAIKLASTPVADRLMAQCPNTLIHTSGLDVGLPKGTMGNSEVGHQNIGAGRIVDQDTVRITKACQSGQLLENQVLHDAMDRLKGTDNALHLMGICSDAGVHGLLDHLYALLDMANSLQVSRVFVHLFTDGRDTGPFTGKGYAQQVQSHIDAITSDAFAPAIVSIIGRYWVMDRDNRWERVERAWACLTGRGWKELQAGCTRYATVDEAFDAHYEHPAEPTMVGDEFIPPCLIGQDDAAVERTRIHDGDSVIFYNYRGDRPREISRAFVFPDDKWAQVAPSPDTGVRGFDRGPKLDLDYVMMTPYSVDLTHYAKVAFPKPPKLKDIAGEYLSNCGLTQFRCAETEKFPHVTFFFNDYRDDPFPGEHREIVQSPKVATYDLKPEMSARGVCDAVLRRLHANDGEPIIIVNFANTDMVGHTGSLPAAIKAAEVVDGCVGEIVDATLAKGGSLIVTADHGNAEKMKDPETGMPFTSHTTYDVPLIVVGEAFCNRSLRRGGRLADIMPTAMDMMGLEKPVAMTGESLLAQ